MFRNLDTKQRALVTAFLVAAVFFLFASPVASRVKDFMLPPSEVQNVKVVQKNNEVQFEWDLNEDSDIESYVILARDVDKKEILPSEVDNYLLTGLNNGTSYSVTMYAEDSAGMESERLNFAVQPSEEVDTIYINAVEEPTVIEQFLPLTITITVLLIVLNVWVLFFNIDIRSFLSVAAFPAITLIPYIALSQSFISTINLEINKLILAAISTVGLVIFSYLLMLTSNILNTSRFAKIPLEQAAKASQFIFSLISLYLILILAFGANISILARIILIMPFVAYFSYATISIIKEITIYEANIRTAAISLVMLVSIIALSMWPISSIYSMLAAAVIYYVLLSIALEIRVKLSQNIWIEFIALGILIAVLLLTNASWGINGTIV